MSTTTTSTSTSRAWALVARREILVKAVDKGFIIGTLLTLAILGGWLGWTAYSAERTNMYAVVTTSADAAMGEQVAEQASHLNDKTVVETRTVADADAATAEVDSGAADGWLHRDGTGWTLTTKSSKGELLSVTQQAVRGATIDDQAKALGTTAADLEAGSVVSPHFLEGDAERAGLAQAVGFAMALLPFMAALIRDADRPFGRRGEAEPHRRDHRDLDPLRHLPPATFSATRRRSADGLYIGV